MKIHRDWTTDGFALAPVAPATGPFPHRGFLRICWDHWREEGDELLLVEGDSGLLPLQRRGESVAFVGDQDLVDYRNPLGDAAAQPLADFLESLPSGTRFRFDSLPDEAVRVIVKALSEVGLPAEPEVHTVSAVVDVPLTFDGYLQAIGKKQRHEVRRKRRRFTEMVGPIRSASIPAEAALDDFARLHRMSPGPKGNFMTERMEGFFGALAQLAEARIDLLWGDIDQPVAAAFGFEAHDGYYLYNSAYDPAYAAASPGIVLISELLERVIVEGLAVFDFLKGAEEYKFRLGAQARRLFVVEGTTK